MPPRLEEQLAFSPDRFLRLELQRWKGDFPNPKLSRFGGGGLNEVRKRLKLRSYCMIQSWRKYQLGGLLHSFTPRFLHSLPGFGFACFLLWRCTFRPDQSKAKKRFPLRMGKYQEITRTIEKGKGFSWVPQISQFSQGFMIQNLTKWIQVSNTSLPPWLAEPWFLNFLLASTAKISQLRTTAGAIMGDALGEGLLLLWQGTNFPL